MREGAPVSVLGVKNEQLTGGIGGVEQDTTHKDPSAGEEGRRTRLPSAGEATETIEEGAVGPLLFTV